ncbi:hypothetical protein EV426DRAFT_721788 [Tirmania nivea]|nr:hypothetical protein EV426DRAFT_721788 [Tirmania nivea]
MARFTTSSSSPIASVKQPRIRTKLRRVPTNTSFTSDSFPLSSQCPPSISTRKRAASPTCLLNAPESKSIRIQERRIEIGEDQEPYCSISDKERVNADAEDSDCVEIKPLPRTDRCRLLSTIPDRLQDLVRHAQNEVADYTLFTMPFLSPAEVLFLLSDAWERAQDSERKYEEKNKAVDAYLKSIHSRNRSHLVAECRNTIDDIFDFRCLAKDEKASKVRWLLQDDRFVYREEHRESFGHRFLAKEIVDVIYNRFYAGKKMKGHQDSKFHEKINKEMVEFKYETAALTYSRLIGTWNKYDPKVQRLMLANIKADLNSRILGHTKHLDVESAEALNVNESASYVSVLKEELEGRLASQQLVWDTSSQRLVQSQREEEEDGDDTEVDFGADKGIDPELED